MNVERLTMMAAMLRGLTSAQRHHFNLSEWVSSTDPDDLEDTAAWRRAEKAHAWLHREHIAGRLAEALVREDCGTTACAVGWACVMPQFNAMGLALGLDFDVYFEGRTGWGAVASFFGIREYDAKQLFLMDSYFPEDQDNPDAVASHIEEFMTREGD